MNNISIELLNEIKKCKRCDTIIEHKKFPRTSHGQLNGKYFLISEAPGKESLTIQQYWVGVGGKILRSCTSAADTTLEKLFYLTDIVKCWPNENDKNRTPHESEISNCSHFLTREIEELKPALIVSFGKPASSFLLRRKVFVKREHGCIYDYNKNTKILVLLHPTGIDRQMDRQVYNRQLISLFIKLKETHHDDIADIFN